MKNPIINNTERNRFETVINGEFAYVEYRLLDDEITLLHTFVPDSGRGTGLSSALAKFALEYVKAEGLKLLVYCPFIARYIKLHPEYTMLFNKAIRK